MNTPDLEEMERLLRDAGRNIVLFDAAFEGKHPRREDGKFKPKGGIPVNPKGKALYEQRKAASEKMAELKKKNPAKAKELNRVASQKARAKSEAELKRVVGGAPITRTGQAWSLFQKIQRQRMKNYVPYYDIPEDPIGTEMVHTVRIKDEETRKITTKEIKLVRGDPNDPPEWVRKLVENGDTKARVPVTVSNVYWAEPNDQGIIYKGVRNTVTKDGKPPDEFNAVGRSEEATLAYQDYKWGKTEPALNGNLPKLREAFEHDSSNEEYGDAASVARLMMATGIRIDTKGGEMGSEGSHIYGASSLKGSHLSTLKDGTIKIEFVGKKSKINTRYVTDNPAMDHDKAREDLKLLSDRAAFGKELSDPEYDRAMECVKILKSNVIYDPFMHRMLTKRKAAHGSGPLFDTSAAKVTEYVSGFREMVPGIIPHNLRMRYADERFRDILLIFDAVGMKTRGKHPRDIGGLPDNESDYKAMVMTAAEIAGDAVNDTIGAVSRSYLNPRSAILMEAKKRAKVGEECRIIPTRAKTLLKELQEKAGRLNSKD